VSRREALVLAAGALLAGAGLLVPRDALLASLAPEATGERLEQLRAGAWLFKALLTLHGAWLLGAGLRIGARPAAPQPAPLWQPPAESQVAGSRALPLLLAGLLATAALLRWIGVGQNLWIDEVFTLVDFVRLPLGQILTEYPNDNQHLLFSALAHLSVSAFGESAAALRLPAVLLGLASLWATLRLVRLVAGPREALLVVALLVVSYHHVWFSQNARGYTGLLFATVLSTDLLLRGLWQGRWSLWGAYVACVTFGMGVQLTMVFVVAAHAIVVLALLVRAGTLSAARWRGPVALVLAGTLTLQLYAFALPQLLGFYLQPAAGATTAEIEWKSALWLLNETIRGFGVGLAFGWLGLLGAALLFATGAFHFLIRAPVATICFVLPALLGCATLIFLDRNLWPRFFFHEIAFAALFGVRGARIIGERAGQLRGRPSPRWGLAFAAALVLASALALPRAYRHPKQDFTGAHDFVLEQLQPGERVVGIDLAGKVYRAYYAPEMAIASTLEELEAQRATDARTWILYTLGIHIAATRPALWEEIQTGFEEVRVFPGTLGGGAIVVRRSLDDPRPADGETSAPR
jgi:hypothetical protein